MARRRSGSLSSARRLGRTLRRELRSSGEAIEPGAHMNYDEATAGGQWLSRNVIGLAINRFLSDFGHEAGTATLPPYLSAISAPLIALGFIEGVADALSSFTKLLGGWLGDRVERHGRWATAGYLLTRVTTGLYGLFAWSPWTLVVRTIGWWAGRGLRSPLHDALLADSVPDSAHGRAFGFDEAAGAAGAIAGPLAALAIVGLAQKGNSGLHGFSIIFWLVAVPGILAAIAILTSPLSPNASMRSQTALPRQVRYGRLPANSGDISRRLYLRLRRLLTHDANHVRRPIACAGRRHWAPTRRACWPTGLASGDF